MKVLLIAAFVALASADVSHLLNQQQQQQLNGYQYQGAQNIPQTSYGVPQSSLLSGASQTYSQGSLSLPSGAPVNFNAGYSSPASSGVSIQYNGYSTPSPLGLGYSTPSSLGLNNIQVSTPAPNLDLSSFQVSSPAPNYQLSGQSANLDLSGLAGFQASTPSSLLQYSQPTSSSYQFLSGLSQQAGSAPSFGLSSVGAPQFTSDALLNSGINFGAAGRFAEQGAFVGQTTGGNLNDAFGVVTDAATGAAAQSDVAKHLYFFAAPEEEEEDVQTKIDLPPQPPKKTYKIIFIKAPAYRNPQTITIPAAPQNDEKTLVYVLVKKPEGQPKVRFQDAAPTQPSKPEVFFIKYKTQKEAEAAVAEIQNKHGASGHVIANLPAGTQTAIQPDHIVSVSTTPAPEFGVSDISGGVSLNALGGTPYVSSTPASFDAALGGNSFVSSTPASFDGALGGASFVSSAPAGFDAAALGGQFVSSTPASFDAANFASSAPASFEGALGGASFVSSAPAGFDAAALGGQTFVSSTPATFDGALGGSSFVSSTPAPFDGSSFVSSTPASFEAGLDNFASSTPASIDAGFSQVSQGPEVTIGAQQTENQDSGLELTVGGISAEVSSPGETGSSSLTGEESVGSEDFHNSIDQAEGFKQYGPPSLRK